MSWADKQLKKYKLRKQIKEIMDSPEFQKERQKELDKHTAEGVPWKNAVCIKRAMQCQSGR